MTSGDVIVGFVGVCTCIVLYAAYKSEPELPQDLAAEVFRRRMASRNDAFPIWLPVVIGSGNAAAPDASANAHADTAHCTSALAHTHACAGHSGGH